MRPIHHDGLTLRALEVGDAAAFAAAAIESVASVRPWLPWCHSAYAEADARDWFAVCRASLQAGTAYEFGVFCDRTAEFLGGAGLNLINAQHATANLGYWVCQSRQGQGVATRCVRALAARAFGVLGLHRVEIVVAVGNEPSAAVARKSGALLEGVARNRLRLHGVSVPAQVFSLVPAVAGVA